MTFGFLQGLTYLNGIGIQQGLAYLNKTGLWQGLEYTNEAVFRYGPGFLYAKELLLLLPLALLVIIGLRKKINRKHLLVHALVAFLLIMALAGPYSAKISSSQISSSHITIISDESPSMDLLQKGVPKALESNLSGSIPVTVTAIPGKNTALGDAVLRQASAENYVLVVSDGQGNSGTPIEEAFSYCYKNGFPVAALVPETLEDDLSIEIEGNNEVIVDTRVNFKARIRKSTENEIRYRLKVTVNRVEILDREITQNDRDLNIEFNHTFEDLGPHTLKANLHQASVSAKSLDYFENNNQYMKSVYVTPKPKVLFVTDNPNSPLANILYEVYDVHTVRSLDSLEEEIGKGRNEGIGMDKGEMKGEGNRKEKGYGEGEKGESGRGKGEGPLIDAVIIDNLPASAIPSSAVETLEKFILNGGGLVVVGGDASFDYPVEQTYHTTKFEKLLPVTSSPSNWRGGRNIVLMLDISPSTTESNDLGGRIIDDILSNAIVLLESDLLRDARVDVITFGSKGQDITNGFLDMSKESNRRWIEAELRDMKIQETDHTSLERGLITAKRLLKDQEEEAVAEIIIVSDGAIGDSSKGGGRFDRAVECADSLHKSGIGIQFIHIHSPKTTNQVTGEGRYYADALMNRIGLSENYVRIEPGQRVNVSFSDNGENFEDRDDNYSTGSLVIYDPKHFITRETPEMTNEILGYNDVTPKPEANRLVITRLGKPVITVRRLGLGRVAALTTDNGHGSGIPWAPSLYAGNDSLIATNTLNWAIADIETGEALRLKVPDLKLNQSGRVLIMTRNKGEAPELYFDWKPMDITPIGSNMYESYITAYTFGLHKITETPFAVPPPDATPAEIAAFVNATTRPVSVNRPDEYTHIGENPLFKTTVLENGGKVYTEEDVYARILEDCKTTTEKEVRTKVVYTKELLGLAFLIYLIYTLYKTYNTKVK